MKISALSLAISLFVGFAFASQSSQSSVSRLVRRGKSESQPFTNTYIMNNRLDYSQGALKIYYPNGAVAFQFEKTFHDIRRGISNIAVKDSNSNPVLFLKSVSTQNR